jgi:hypothetical protein
MLQCGDNRGTARGRGIGEGSGCLFSCKQQEKSRIRATTCRPGIAAKLPAQNGKTPTPRRPRARTADADSRAEAGTEQPIGTTSRWQHICVARS